MGSSLGIPSGPWPPSAAWSRSTRFALCAEGANDGDARPGRAGLQVVELAVRAARAAGRAHAVSDIGCIAASAGVQEASARAFRVSPSSEKARCRRKSAPDALFGLSASPIVAYSSFESASVSLSVGERCWARTSTLSMATSVSARVCPALAGSAQVGSVTQQRRASLAGASGVPLWRPRQTSKRVLARAESDSASADNKSTLASLDMLFPSACVR